MECRKFEFTILSAHNVKNVRQIFRNRLRVYAKVSLGGNPRTQKTTPVDKEGQTSPVWNFSASFTIGKNAVKSEEVQFLIQLYCSRRSCSDGYMGEVSVSLKELFDRFSSLPQGEDTAKVSYPVKEEDAYSQGEVCFSYKFGDIFAYQPPPIDWGNVCLQGTKLMFKGGALCLRLTLLANGNIFDLPIDAAADVAYTTYDILSQVFGSGADLLADIPWGTGTDLPVDISNLPADIQLDDTDWAMDTSYPAADVPGDVDTTSGLPDNTNVSAGSDVPAEGTSAAINLSAEAPSCGEDADYHPKQTQELYRRFIDRLKAKQQEAKNNTS